MAKQKIKIIKAKSKPEEQYPMHHQNIFSLGEEFFLYARILHKIPPTHLYRI